MAFVIGSYAMHFFLGRYLSEVEYGVVGTIITIMNFEYIFFTDGIRQGMAKSISSGKWDVRGLIRTGVLFQLLVVGLFFAGTYFGAPLIAAGLGDDSLIPYIRGLAWLLPFTGFYSLSLGILNGHKDFKNEAVIGMIYPVLKLSVIPFVLFVFSDAVFGTEAGFLFAAVSIMLLSVWRVYAGRGQFLKSEAKLSFGEYGKVALNYLLLFCVSTILMNLDTLILKRVSGNDEIVGYYTGVATFAKIPYFLLTAFYTVALPIVTRNYASGELRRAREAIGSMLGIILSLVLPVVTVISAAASWILMLFYKPSYRAGGPALSLLVFAIFFLGMTLVFTMILSAADKKKHIAGISVTMLLLQFLLCPFLTSCFSLTGTALATFITAGGGMLVSGFFTFKTFGCFTYRVHLWTLAGNLTAFPAFLALFHRAAIGNFWVLVLICGICYLPAAAAGAFANGLIAPHRRRR